ncbi:MAG: antA/AntB antirepressor family protein [Desulfamplus sp.]|nr:antA/AntB antirepressor family protein [Desulfamplus sp.]
MSNDLIPINTDSNGQQTVNARNLHEFIENKDHFTTWITDRIKQYDFVENQDFVSFSENSEKGRPKQEYHITIDMAKELSMVERNEKGKQARQYFIKMENIAKSKTLAVPNFSNPAEAARAWALEYEEKQKALAMVERKNIALEEIIETRTWIQDKKVATSMATASVAVRENGKLKDQLGESKTWKTAKAIPWLSDFFELSKAIYKIVGMRLSKISKSLGYNTKKVPDTDYGTINAYHIEVINHFKCKLTEDPNMMREYRRAA